MALSNIRSCLSQPQKMQYVFIQLLIFFMFLCLHAMSISFNISNFKTNDPNLSLQQDANTDSEGLQLTLNTLARSINQSAGRAFYNERVRLWDNSTGRLTVTDFTTHFSFTIQVIGGGGGGDGLAFFIAPFNTTMPNNSAGGAIGLLTSEAALNGTPNPQNQIVAIEFDTFRNDWDPNDNHVGIDVNSIVSVKNVTLLTAIKGSRANAWITYNSSTQNLRLRLRV